MRPVRISYWMVTSRITLSGPSAGSGLRRMRGLPTRTRGRRVTGRARRACCPARTRAAAPPGVRGAAPPKPPGARCTPGIPRCAPRSARRPGTPRPASVLARCGQGPTGSVPRPPGRPSHPVSEPGPGSSTEAFRGAGEAGCWRWATNVRWRRRGRARWRRWRRRSAAGRWRRRGLLRASRPGSAARIRAGRCSRRSRCGRRHHPSLQLRHDAVGLLVSDSAAARAWNTVNRASVASCWWWLMRASSRPYASRRAARCSRGASLVCPGVVGDPFRIAYGLRRWRLGGWGAHDAPAGVPRGDDVDQVSTTACRTASSSRVRPGRPASPAQRAGSDGLSSPRTAAPSRSRRRTPWCRARRRPGEAVGLRPFWRGCLAAQATPRTQPSEQIAGRERDDRGDGDVHHVHRIPIADSSSTRSGDSVAARLR
ncbi:hypothetical protein SUDANB2_07204 [Streptomyces sp. enrichment culture]